jgi:hypothetical protein
MRGPEREEKYQRDDTFLDGGDAYLDQDLTLLQCRDLFFTHVQIIGGALAVLDEDALHFFRDGGGHCAVPKKWAD